MTPIMDTAQPCDAEKNTKCLKKACFLCGGFACADGRTVYCCQSTTKEEFAMRVKEWEAKYGRKYKGIQCKNR